MIYIKLTFLLNSLPKLIISLFFVKKKLNLIIYSWYRGKVKTVPEMTGGKPSPSKKSKLRKRETSALDIDGTNTKTKKVDT